MGDDGSSSPAVEVDGAKGGERSRFRLVWVAVGERWRDGGAWLRDEGGERGATVVVAKTGAGEGLRVTPPPPPPAAAAADPISDVILPSTPAELPSRRAAEGDSRDDVVACGARRDDVEVAPPAPSSSSSSSPLSPLLPPPAASAAAEEEDCLLVPTRDAAGDVTGALATCGLLMICSPSSSSSSAVVVSSSGLATTTVRRMRTTGTRKRSRRALSPLAPAVAACRPTAGLPSASGNSSCPTELAAAGWCLAFRESSAVVLLRLP